MKLTPLLIFPVFAMIGQAEFLPLQVGNQWVLQTAAAKPELLNIEVLRSRVQNSTVYYLVSGYSSDPKWIRNSEDGTVYALDEASGQEVILARLSAGGAGYESPLSGCKQPAQPAAQVAPYRSATFDVDGALTVTYSPGGCRDIGFTGETYAPEIGLVRRAITTIRGETVLELIHARVNGSAVLGKSKEIVLTSDFNTGSKAWLAGFSDYNLGTNDLRMLAELRPLPDEVSGNRGGFYLQSMNRSDDLFMYLKKQITTEDGLEPNQAYRVSFHIRMSSNAPTGCVGVGGSPGDSVYLKAGGSIDEPVALLAGNGFLQVSVEKGDQSQGGRDLGVAGTIANGRACDGTESPYVSLVKEYAHPQQIRTDDRGSLWVILGTDSGYEGLTGLYIESVTVRINPAVEPADAPR